MRRPSISFSHTNTSSSVSHSPSIPPTILPLSLIHVRSAHTHTHTNTRSFRTLRLMCPGTRAEQPKGACDASTAPGRSGGHLCVCVCVPRRVASHCQPGHVLPRFTAPSLGVSGLSSLSSLSTVVAGDVGVVVRAETRVSSTPRANLRSTLEPGAAHRTPIPHQQAHTHTLTHTQEKIPAQCTWRKFGMCPVKIMTSDTPTPTHTHTQTQIANFLEGFLRVCGGSAGSASTTESVSRRDAKRKSVETTSTLEKNGIHAIYKKSHVYSLMW